MSRSVSIPSGAYTIAYADVSENDWEWDELLDQVRDYAQSRYPSLEACRRWLDQESQAILENGHAILAVSEYNGLVCLAIIPKNESLAPHWCKRVDLKDLVQCFGPALISKGRFSNGEQVFIRADRSSRENISSNGSRW